MRSSGGTITAMDKPDKPDFDPTHLLDGWKPAGEAARPELDLAHLLDGLRTAAPIEALADPARLSRLKKRGFAMDDVEDVLLPEIHLPPIPPPAPLDEAGLSMALQAASNRAQPPRPARDPRLLAGWQAGCWIGVVCQALAASTELVNTPDGPLIDSHPPQWLAAVWQPQGLDAPLLGRWPDQALLTGAQDRSAATQALLRGLPETALLWRGDVEVDWVLTAELVLHHDAALKPWQLSALRTFVEAQKLLTFERLNGDYEAATALRPLQRR